MPPTLSCTPQLAKGDSSYFPENITPTLSKYRKLMACSHVSPRGCPPAKRHMGTAASCVSWMLEMVQGEVGCGLTALWWEVQAHWSSSSFSSALSAASSFCIRPQWVVGSPGIRGSPQLLAAAALGGGGGTGMGHMRSRPLRCCFAPCPPPWSCVPIARPQPWEHGGRRKQKDVFSLMHAEMCKLVVSDLGKLNSLEERR